MNTRYVRLTLALAAVPLLSCGSSVPDCQPGRICTVVGNGQIGLTPDGALSLQTRLYLPQDVTVGPDGRPYFIDWNNHRIRVLLPDYTVHTVLGTGELGDGPPGPALQHRLNHPTNIAFDPAGRMIVAAWHNSKIKRVDLNTGMAEDICGTGMRAFAGDGGPASSAVLDLPVGVAIAANGDMYIADQANQRIRRIGSDGNINTIVGNGMPGYSGDGGPATMAQIANPVGQAAAPAGRIALDDRGNLYIADTNNHRIRRVDAATGIITTIAGTGTAGYSGDEGPATAAELNGPTDIEIAPDGTIYIADTQNNCVRTITTEGTIHTFAGRCGVRGFAGDGGPPTEAQLNRPYGIEIDPQGNVWIADTYNHRLRMVAAARPTR